MQTPPAGLGPCVHDAVAQVVSGPPIESRVSPTKSVSDMGVAAADPRHPERPRSRAGLEVGTDYARREGAVDDFNRIQPNLGNPVAEAESATSVVPI